MGIVIGSAVAPIAFSITWAKCSAAGAVSGALVGLVGAIITWTVTAHSLFGEVTIDTLGHDYPMLAGKLRLERSTIRICHPQQLWSLFILMSFWQHCVCWTA